MHSSQHDVTDPKTEQSNSFFYYCMPAVYVHAFTCVYANTDKHVREVKTVCLLTWGLPRSHGRLSHAGRPLREAWGGNARLARHHALLLESCPPLFLQLLLDLVDLLCQQVVILRLESIRHEGGRLLQDTQHIK